MTENTSNNLVEPQTLKGFQDLLPNDVLARKHVLRVIESVFQQYGFLPVETPALEFLTTLLGTGGEETNKELFRLESPEGEPIALRFDQTVPLARLLAQYPDQLKAPFRRYAIGPVWRADKPGPWRFREFTQVDIDVAGADSIAVDGEVVSIVCEILNKLGAEQYVILINNRKLVDALLDGCGIHEEARRKHVLRVVDKLQKVGLDHVRLELGNGRIDESGDPIPGVKLEPAVIDQIIAFIGITGDTRADVIMHLEQMLPDSEASAQALAELRELDACLSALGVSERHARFAPSLARGLDYYTGPVFEIAVTTGEFPSIGGGGRYDRLVERFLGRMIPCTGISFGLDRLMGALQHLGALPQLPPPVQALIVTLGNVPRQEALRLAAELRAAGVRTETYFGQKKGMKQQLSHADHYGIPVAVILGEDELTQGVVSVKDLMTGKRERETITDHSAYRQAGKTGQVTVSRDNMVEAVKSLLVE